MRLATRGRKHAAPPVDIDGLPPGPRAEISELRAREARNQRSSEVVQRRENMLALLYNRVIDVADMVECPWKYLDHELGWKRGREGTMPPRAFMEHKGPVAIVVTPATADALIKRDSV